MVFAMSPSTPQSVTSAVYNFMISTGSLFSLGIFALTAYQWGWYPQLEQVESRHYLGNEKVAYYFWLLAAIVIVAVFWTLLIGYMYDIGLDRSEVKHKLLVNEETPVQSTGNRQNTEIITSEFVELS